MKENFKPFLDSFFTFKPQEKLTVWVPVKWMSINEKMLDSGLVKKFGEWFAQSLHKKLISIRFFYIF